MAHRTPNDEADSWNPGKRGEILIMMVLYITYFAGIVSQRLIVLVSLARVVCLHLTGSRGSWLSREWWFASLLLRLLYNALCSFAYEVHIIYFFVRCLPLRRPVREEAFCFLSL